jgi:hypothetical protein
VSLFTFIIRECILPSEFGTHGYKSLNKHCRPKEKFKFVIANTFYDFMTVESSFFYLNIISKICVSINQYKLVFFFPVLLNF